mmetsp:Transcript_29967/g.75493  ORF Transcript_29967/g.75493 Transcript_29967/m.75493 type:complete len:223 (-) Transcript_29967:1048-1716(-)
MATARRRPASTCGCWTWATEPAQRRHCRSPRGAAWWRRDVSWRWRWRTPPTCAITPAGRSATRCSWPPGAGRLAACRWSACARAAAAATPPPRCSWRWCALRCRRSGEARTRRRRRWWAGRPTQRESQVRAWRTLAPSWTRTSWRRRRWTSTSASCAGAPRPRWTLAGCPEPSACCSGQAHWAARWRARCWAGASAASRYWTAGASPSPTPCASRCTASRTA